MVEILPNKVIGVLGNHDGFPIERLGLSRDSSILGSCSHDSTIKFWNVSYFFSNPQTDQDIDDDDDDDSGEQSNTGEAAAIKRAMRKQKKKSATKKSFFSDL